MQVFITVIDGGSNSFAECALVETAVKEAFPGLNLEGQIWHVPNTGYGSADHLKFKGDIDSPHDLFVQYKNIKDEVEPVNHWHSEKYQKRLAEERAKHPMEIINVLPFGAKRLMRPAWPQSGCEKVSHGFYVITVWHATASAEWCAGERTGPEVPEPAPTEKVVWPEVPDRTKLVREEEVHIDLLWA